MDQTVQLKGMDQGHDITLVITQAPSNCRLQFRHAGDTTWATYPDFSGVATGGVLVETFLCVSAEMRIVFDTVPSSNVFISTVVAAKATF